MKNLRDDTLSSFCLLKYRSFLISRYLSLYRPIYASVMNQSYLNSQILLLNDNNDKDN